MFFWKRKELFTTFHPEMYQKTVSILKKNNIFFEVKTKFTGSKNGVLRNIGENVMLETQYKIFVKKEDYDRALFLIGK